MADPSHVHVMVVSGSGNNSTGNFQGITHHSGLQAASIQSTSVCPLLIDKVTLKAVSKEKKSVSKMFQLRNINPLEIQSYSSLVTLIRSQLQGDITTEDFDVGYISGSNCISIRNKEDVVEVWNNIRKGASIILWCDGLRNRASNKRQLSSNDDDDATCGTKKDNQEWVQQVVDTPKKQHGEKFNTACGQKWQPMGYTQV